MDHAIQSVKLSQLVPMPERNARVHEKGKDIKELAQNLRELGLIHAITVRETAPVDNVRMFEIIDGERRFAALKRLEAEGIINGEFTVPILCRTDDDATAGAVSLAANIMRLPLHPADQYASFARLHAEGRSVPEIAQMFALKKKAVEKTLALGNLAPAVLQAYRTSSNMSEEIIRLLTRMSHEEQTKVLPAIVKGKLKEWELKTQLESGQVAVTHPLAQFVGLDAYREAGGQVVNDLFGGGELLTDSDLVIKLAKKRSDELVDKLKADGWKWVAFAKDLPEDYSYRWSKIEQRDNFANAQDEERWGQIKQRKQAIDDIEETVSNQQEAELAQEYGDLEEEEDAIRDRFIQSWSDKDIRRAGIVINFKPKGQDDFITYGWLNPADLKAEKREETAKKKEKARKNGESKLNTTSATQGISRALEQDLEAVLTDATKMAIAHDANAADVVMICAMVSNFAKEVYDESMEMEVRGPVHPQGAVHKEWAMHLNRTIKDLGIPAKNLAKMFDAVNGLAKSKRDVLRSALIAGYISTLSKGATLTVVTTVHPEKVFKPDAAFFSRLSKDQVCVAFKEAGLQVPDSTLKKSELCELAARELGKTGWLPEILRTPTYGGPVKKKKGPAKKAA